jgi:aspartate/methionine/tyrosine aminotransferase
MAGEPNQSGGAPGRSGPGREVVESGRKGSMEQYYYRATERLEMYQRLIQYWSMIFSRKENIFVLDNMNFNISIFPQIFEPAELFAFHQIEPGYMSPDGYTELNDLIRELEYARLVKSDPTKAAFFGRLVQEAGVGCGNGCSNVMNAVLNSILKLPEEDFPRKNPAPEIILTLPSYTVYAAQLSNLKTVARPRYAYARRQNSFLPTFEDIRQKVTRKTVAIILTYPSNPSQSTYESDKVGELKKIVEFCQQEGIFLVVDNIYQDLVFPIGRRFEEVFNLTASLDYVFKIYGSSKDTPFYSGFRTGYWFGDPRISEIYKYYISSTENSLNTCSLVLFALNLYFKILTASNSTPALDDMRFFSQGVFGWSQAVNEEELFGNLLALNLYEKYNRRIKKSNELQENAIKRVIEFVNQSDCFIDYANQNIGNVFFIRVNPEFFDQDDDEFFRFLYYEARCGVLPGNVFGMALVPGEVWFRITLIHDTCDNIVQHLGKMETSLRGRAP